MWVEFTLTNLTGSRLTLRVPELSAEPADTAEMGLPLEHVFSGWDFSGPVLEDDLGERHDSRVKVRPKQPVPAIRIRPHGSVGVRLDLTEYYESLARPGKYKLIWEPYKGTVRSEPLHITVMAERQAVILTDYGEMTVRFYYDEAPNQVQSFIELVEQRFYDRLTFNRVIPGGLIQGGDPLGNRRGIRPDGKRLKAEFSSIPFDLGTVGMARSSQDPDSASCQFFICLGRQPSFDGQQTAFGYLYGDKSFETLKRIAAVPTHKYHGLDDYPVNPVYIRAISLENVPHRERPKESLKEQEQKPATTQPAVEIDPATVSQAAGAQEGEWAKAQDQDQGGQRPVHDLPGLKATGHVGPWSRPATEPAE